MPLTIQSEQLNDAGEFQGNKDEAQKLLNDLRNHIVTSRGEYKTGSMRLVKTGSDYQLKRYTWWNTAAREKQAAQFLQSVIKIAYSEPSSSSSTVGSDDQKSVLNHDNDVHGHALRGIEQTLRSKAKERLQSYTKGTPQKIGTQDLAKALYNQEFTSEGTTLLPPSSGSFFATTLDHSIVHDFLDEAGVIVEKKPIGTGCFGAVYKAKIAGKSNYVLKMEREVQMEWASSTTEKVGFGFIKTDKPFSFFKRGDLAASCVKELKNVVQPTFVILAVQKTASSKKEYHYVPVAKATAFGEKLIKDYPHALVGMVGQIMEQIPGQDLKKLVQNRTLDFSPSSRHFKNVFNLLGEYFESSYQNGYVHRDLHAGNIMYDPESGRGKVVDNGLAAALEPGERLYEDAGAYNIQAPQVQQSISYGGYSAEVDAYSITTTLKAILWTNLRNTNSAATSKTFAEMLAGASITKELGLLEYIATPSLSESDRKKAFKEWQAAFHGWQAANGPFPIIEKEEQSA